MRHKKTILALSLLFAMSTTGLAYGDNAPTISITTPSGVVKGLASVSFNAATDPVGTSKLSHVAIAITGISSYTAALGSSSGNYYSPGGYNGCDLGSYGSSNVCWGTSNIASGTYISYFDTTSWPTGTYQVTAYVEDSNGRVTASAPISVSLPKTIRINLIQLATSNGTSSYKANLLGVSSVEGGTLSLYSSDQKDGTYTKNVDFLLGVNGLTVQATIAPGTWVKAELSGSETIKDVESSPLQVLGQLKAACVFPASGGVGSRFSGKCTFNYSLTNTPVLLQTNIGSGWGTVANGSISGNVLTPSVTPKKSGKLQVRLISPGQSGLYSSFISNVSIIQISASKKH